MLVVIASSTRPGLAAARCDLRCYTWLLCSLTLKLCASLFPIVALSHAIFAIFVGMRIRWRHTQCQHPQVLIHCLCGTNRSAALAIGYLISTDISSTMPTSLPETKVENEEPPLELPLLLEAAVARVFAVRPTILSNHSFRVELAELELRLRPRDVGPSPS